MTQLASLPPDSSREAQEHETIRAFLRQPGEPLFWYNRFKRYFRLGYKRSLQAAVEQERAQIKALKGTEVEEKPEAASPKSGQKRSKTVTSQLVEVPKPKQVQVVPGSWRRASVQWQWGERARAYDEYQIDKMVNKSIDALLEGAGTSFHRTMMLKSLLEFMRENFNASALKMDFEQACTWIARMQSLLKQIADEMAEYDESMTRVLLRHTCTVSYQQGPKQEPKQEPAVQPHVDPPASANEKSLASSLEELRRELKSRR